MRKFLAVLLAVAMLAAGNVTALAAETATGETGDTTTSATTPDATTPEDTTTPGDTVNQDAPITTGGCYPGETIRRGWSILAPKNTQTLVINTDLKITDWSHDNGTDFESGVVEDAGVLRYWFKPTNPLTSVEDVGKFIEDTIHITLENGETYSFKLSVDYIGGAKVATQNQERVFTLGKQVTLNVKILDPTDDYALPQIVEFEQQNMADYKNNRETPEENWQFRVDEIKLTEGEKDFSVTVTPIQIVGDGVAHISINTSDANGKGYGQGWQVQVIREGEEPKGSSRIESASENQRAESAAMDALESVNEAIASGETMPAKAQTVTTAGGESATVVSTKLYGLSATLSVGAMETLADSKVGLRASLDNGAAEVIIPGGFTMPTGTGVLAYSLGFQKDPLYSNIMAADVAAKNPDAKTEVYRVGGGTLPTTATVTIKTKITGRVNVYYWNEDTRRYTLISSPTAENGKVTFATKQLGNLVVTTGTI